MSSQEIDLIVTLLLICSAFFVVNLNKGKKKGDPRNYYMGAGQFFDSYTYIGNIRSIALFSLMTYIGWHFDEIGRWLWHQFGNELIVSSGKERWHRMVVVAMGTGGSIVSVLFMYRIFLKRHKQNKENEIERLRQFHNSHKE